MDSISEWVAAKLISAHRCKEPEIARLLHGFALDEARRFDHRGDRCMAHAKRLQARYWAKRMMAPSVKLTLVDGKLPPGCAKAWGIEEGLA